MKTALPENAKIAKEAKECMQECVSEFISFITSEGAYLFAMLFLPTLAADVSLILVFDPSSIGEVPAGETENR